MCTFMTPMKKKIPDRNLDTSCPAGIPCNNNNQIEGIPGPPGEDLEPTEAR